MKTKHPISINTKILDSQGRAVPVKIENGSNYCRIHYEDKKIGEVSFIVEEDCIFINYMYNTTLNTENPLKYVGTALVEYVLGISLALGKNGNIEFDSANASSPAYYKMGFRKKGEAFHILEQKIHKYKANKNSVNENEITKEAYWYKELKQEAAAYLKKDIDHITFDEALEYGKYSSDNDKFGEFIQGNKHLTSNDCYMHRMEGYRMYLPKENILKFHINPPSLIEDLSYNDHTCIKLLDGKLMKLVEGATLDHTNVEEFAGQYPNTTKKIDTLGEISDHNIE